MGQILWSQLEVMPTAEGFYHLNSCHLSAASFAVLLKHTHAWLLLLVSLLAERHGTGEQAGWWVKAQSSQLLTLLCYWSVSRLALCQQLNISWVRICVICEGAFSGRTGFFCLPHFEMLWVLWRHGRKKALSYRNIGSMWPIWSTENEWSFWTVNMITERLIFSCSVGILCCILDVRLELNLLCLETVSFLLYTGWHARMVEEKRVSLLNEHVERWVLWLKITDETINIF